MDDSRNELISQYVRSVKEKDQLLQKQGITALTEDELHKLLLLNSEMNDLVGRMIEVEIAEE
ncbi:hypothetical protein [Paenibacillus puerhi]|uniref:hypothetical protein n=1 Tax=Paenibacillus puerhi TaxID=2692622 RepID=UPI00135AE884|nr:hypothetical protein [Paenibacillus puerhi]